MQAKRQHFHLRTLTIAAADHRLALGQARRIWASTLSVALSEWRKRTDCRRRAPSLAGDGRQTKASSISSPPAPKVISNIWTVSIAVPSALRNGHAAPV
jgi:hypothetical protein